MSRQALYKSRRQASPATPKRRVIALLDQVFLEYASLFSDTFGVTSKELLLKCPTPEDMLAVSTRKLTSLLNKASHGRFGEEKAKEVRDAERFVWCWFCKERLCISNPPTH